MVVSTSPDLQSQNLLNSYHTEDNSACGNNKVSKTYDNNLVHATNEVCPADDSDMTSDLLEVMDGQTSEKVRSMSLEEAEATQQEETKSNEATYACDGPNGLECLDILENNSVEVEDADVGPNGLECLAGMENKSVEVEDAGIGPNGQRCLDILENKSVEVEDADFGPNGRECLAGMENKSVEVEDADIGRNGQTYLDVLENNSVEVEDADFGPNGLECLTGMENKSVEVEDTGVAPDGQGCLYGMDSKLVDMQNAFNGTNGLQCLAEMESKSIEGEDAGVGPNGQRCLDNLENKCGEVEDGNDELIMPTHPTGIKRKAFQILDGAAKPDFLSLRFTIFDVLRYMSTSILILMLITVVSCDFVGPQDQTVLRNQSAVLKCRTSGTAPLKWSKDGNEIFSGYHFRPELQHRYSIIKNQQGQYDLVISKADEETIGNYTCLQPGDLKYKIARLMIGYGSTMGPFEDNGGRVTNIQRDSDTSTSDSDISESIAATSTVPKVIGAVVVIAVILGALIVGILTYPRWKNRTKSSGDTHGKGNALLPK